jgi:RNA binding exosome subunit
VKIHHISVSTFSAKEDLEGLRQILTKLLPKDVVLAEKIIEPEEDGGVFTQELIELNARISKQKDIRAFTKKIFDSLDEYDMCKLKDNIRDFVDDNCNFYLRLSKDELASGNIVLETKDSIHIIFKVAAYPAKKDNAVKIVGGLMSG